MPQAEVYSPKGEKVGEIGLPSSLFGKEPNRDLMRAAVLAHLNARRVGTAKAKTRAEVRGGGRKPWRQKGLGRARAGTITSPLWRHGGVVFGPMPRDYSWSLPKKVRRAALLSALSSKAQKGDVRVLTDLTMAAPKTKDLFAFLTRLDAQKSVLIVTDAHEPNVVLSARNIPGVRVTSAVDLSTYEVMAKKHVLITQGAVRKLEEMLL